MRRLEATSPHDLNQAGVLRSLNWLDFAKIEKLKFSKKLIIREQPVAASVTSPSPPLLAAPCWGAVIEELAVPSVLDRGTSWPPEVVLGFITHTTRRTARRGGLPVWWDSG